MTRTKLDGFGRGAGAIVGKSLAKDARGANLVEYAVVLGAIALLAVAGARFFGISVAQTAMRQARCLETLTGCQRDDVVRGVVDKDVHKDDDEDGPITGASATPPSAVGLPGRVGSEAQALDRAARAVGAFYNGISKAYMDDLFWGKLGYRPSHEEYWGAVGGHLLGAATGALAVFGGGTIAGGGTALAVVTAPVPVVDVGTAAVGAASVTAGAALAGLGVGVAVASVKNLHQMREGSPTEGGGEPAAHVGGEPAGQGGGQKPKGLENLGAALGGKALIFPARNGKPVRVIELGSDPHANVGGVSMLLRKGVVRVAADSIEVYDLSVVGREELDKAIDQVLIKNNSPRLHIENAFGDFAVFDRSEIEAANFNLRRARPTQGTRLNMWRKAPKPPPPSP
jgi:Flp pilus assembly pilin Flp